MRSWAQSRPQELTRLIERDEIEPMEVLIEEFQERLRSWQEQQRRLDSE
jgi:hypothetical protein